MPGTACSWRLPPKEPSRLESAHVPCDIVLVLDVSASMAEFAPIMKPGERDENPGCTVLDIVKHAARTIIHTLDEKDRLGLVTFSTVAKARRPLLPMTPENKKSIENIINGLQTESGTNMWRGLERGLELFNVESDTNRVPALMLLTDGLPNQGEPAGGYAQALRARGPLLTTIYTFGFGPSIKSGLLSTMAEIGGGYYGFIPHSNMVCTVTVNAVAHLQSTFVTNCRLDLRIRSPIQLQISTGQVLEMRQGHIFSDFTVSVALGSIQYGQSRHIYLRFNEKVGDSCVIKPELAYSGSGGRDHILGCDVPITQASTLSANDMAFHRNRSILCRFILSLFPLGRRGYIVESRDSANRVSLYGYMLEALSAAKDGDDRCNQALHEQVEGLIRQAVYADDDEWNGWGKHYLLSVWAAHAKQLRTTFLDPGVQMYDAESPLFAKCQTRLTKAFEEEVAPPKPSRLAEADPVYSSGSATLHMGSYSGRSLMYSQNPFATPKSSRK
ncbi:inter-alpha-trypsin inhibitor heavy chain H3 [Apiospora hydei]|uniref:Inter-alpha-trypsin inhibitor heavy chain H3 n=1 Tax=Apiospora hydei TaxID=1337664 RepID=A0ABR1UT70_9PEZI